MINKKIFKLIKKNKINNILFYNNKYLININSIKKIIKYILCTKKKKICNKCLSCNLYNNNNHPDFLIINSLYYKNNIEFNKNIKIKKLKLLNKFLNFSNICSKKKIILIYYAEYLNKNSFNYLINFLENKKRNLLIILVTNNIQNVNFSILFKFFKILYKKNNFKKKILKNNYINKIILQLIKIKINSSFKKFLNIIKNIPLNIIINVILKFLEDIIFFKFTKNVKNFLYYKIHISFLSKKIKNIYIIYNIINIINNKLDLINKKKKFNILYFKEILLNYLYIYK
ncbi:putative DNA polymerase III, delta prime subunit [Candidatus Zinderia insecticola CARI]|uniref:Putative DNA polymerase III, delta prime subunit n=1 Tax=Zinderia insecticola (strain CARI) TaxID=871271 RepID=E0TIM6_ZINIC|nr:putative DNA polymerase III, delta prime subunit [Candidatus Zinderia insecticola CARI]